jgi:hypothetical protein
VAGIFWYRSVVLVFLFLIGFETDVENFIAAQVAIIPLNLGNIVLNITTAYTQKWIMYQYTTSFDNCLKV